MNNKALRISSVSNPADSFAAAFDSFIVFCESKNLSPNTIGFYRIRLQAFLNFLDNHAQSSAPRDLSRQLVREFITDEMRRHSPTTANHSLTSVRALFRFLCEEGFLQINPTDGVAKLRQRKNVIETFSQEQIEAILAGCGKDFVGIRDKAIITMLYDCGFRASEICGITTDDVDWKQQTIKVLGKGNRERVVSFGKATRQALSLYVARRPDLATYALFVTNLGDTITRFRLAEIVGARCKKANIQGVRCSPHTFRHTFAVSYLRTGGDVFSLQRILGHSDLGMTRRYAELSQTDVQEKHRMFSPADRLTQPRSERGMRRRIA